MWRNEAVQGEARLKSLLYAYRVSLTWQHYQHWRANRNPERAALEIEHNYDTKHAAHLLRLYRMGIEILKEGVVRVKRPDAEWLRSVQKGAYSYPELLTLIASLQLELAEAEATIHLPEMPDEAAVEALIMEMHSDALRESRFL